MKHPIIYWSLFASVVVVGIAGLVAYIFIKKKIKKMQGKYLNELEAAERRAITEKKYGKEKNYDEASKKLQKAINRENLGELLWDFDADLINQKIPHLPFIDMEFLISTIYRNEYKSLLNFASTCGYELITIATMRKMNLFYEKILNNEIMKKNIKKYKINKSLINKFNPDIPNVDIVLISVYEKKNIIDFVDRGYKKLSNNWFNFYFRN